MRELDQSQQNRGQRGEWSAADAHNNAMALNIGEVVRGLVDLLGATAVAAIGGVGETRAVTQWGNGRMPQRPNVLRFALQVGTMILSTKDPDIVRAWFHGSNPYLADRVPLVMLRDEPLAEIQVEMMAAARAFASR
jgi:hypothetical protein